MDRFTTLASCKQTPMNPTINPVVSKSSFVLPARTAEEQTRASVVDGSRGRNAQWRWYAGCIRDMLAGMGCPTADREDVTHDFLIEKLEHICELYEPSQGRFRPYLYRAVQNAWRDRLRQNRARDERSQFSGDSDRTPDPSDRIGRQDDLSVLNLFFDRLFSRFTHQRTLTDVGFFLLRDWCLTGRDLKETIASQRLSVSPEYARKIRAAAITEFASFIEQHLNEQDFSLIAEQAMRDGASCAAKARTDLIIGAFVWPSEKKRLGIVAAILRRVYLKEQGGQRVGEDL